MKVIILAGGFGTRLGEYTETIPKPMVKIGGLPILWHIMQRYAHYGYQEFFIALGYKAEVIKNFFFSFSSPKFDTPSDFPSFQLEINNFNGLKCKVTLVDTGLDTMTGGRLKRMKPYIGEEIFMLTYGDGLADIDINLLVNFHKKHEKMVTVTAVHPAARFGELDLDGDLVKSFQEKPQVNRGWINGGFFVINPKFFDFLAIINIVIGIIVFVVNFNDYLEYGLTGLGISVICFVVTKFISEIARILADIANNVKLIQINLHLKIFFVEGNN